MSHHARRTETEEQAEGRRAYDWSTFRTAIAARERQGVALWWLLTAVRTDLGCDLRTVTLTTVPRTMLSTIENLLAQASKHLPLRILVQPVEVAVLADAALVVVTTLPRERLLVPPVGPLPGNAPVMPINPADWAILEQALIAHRTCVALEAPALPVYDGAAACGG
jgi:hypothetical protein